MAVFQCLGCGRYTNSSVCDYLEHPDWKPRKCYARYRQDNSMEHGCAYDDAPEYVKTFITRELLDSEEYQNDDLS